MALPVAAMLSNRVHVPSARSFFIAETPRTIEFALWWETGDGLEMADGIPLTLEHRVYANKDNDLLLLPGVALHLSLTLSSNPSRF